MTLPLATHEEVPTHRRQRRGLIGGVLVPPLAWLAQLQANYALASWVCRSGNRHVSLLVAAAALVIAGAAGGWAWRCWPAEEPLTGDPQRIEGVRLLAMAALVSSASFVVVLVASAIPLLILRPCD